MRKNPQWQTENKCAIGSERKIMKHKSKTVFKNSIYIRNL